MKIIIDEENNKLLIGEREIDLYSKEAFKLISDIYLKVGWDQKYLYSFTWFGRPVIQLPDDLIRIQEVIYSIKPDVIIETGIAHGGSLIFYASLCKSMEKGRIIGIDIEIRPHNRKAIEEHELFEYLTLIEGSSISQDIFNSVKNKISNDDKIIVILDSCHTYDHVLNELRLYSQLVTKDSYIVATDGSQEYLGITPRAKKEYSNAADWKNDNPKRAAEDFTKENKNFKIVEPEFLFNEGSIDFRITHWPSAFIKRIK